MSLWVSCKRLPLGAYSDACGHLQSTGGFPDLGWSFLCIYGLGWDNWAGSALSLMLQQASPGFTRRRQRDGIAEMYKVFSHPIGQSTSQRPSSVSVWEGVTQGYGYQVVGNVWSTTRKWQGQDSNLWQRLGAEPAHTASFLSRRFLPQIFALSSVPGHTLGPDLL